MHLKSEHIMIALKQLPACQWGILSLMKEEKMREKSDRGGLVRLKIPVWNLAPARTDKQGFPWAPFNYKAQL